MVAAWAGAVCAAASVLAQGGRLLEPLDLAANFAPLWLAGGCAVFAYGLLFASSRRWLLLALGGLAAVAAGGLIAPEFVRTIPTAPTAARTIRIIQFNTWDENTHVAATADWVAAQSPDVVVVEEAEPPIRSALVARGFVLTPGVGHMAIFSRVRPIGRPAALALFEWPLMPPFARATFEDASGEYTIIGAHLPQPTYAVAAPQRLMLSRMLSRYDPERLIVVGDFNLTPWSFALRRLDATLGLVRLDRALWSWPARLRLGGLAVKATPFLPIDHIYAGPAWRRVRLRRGPALGSDHFPLVADLAQTQ